MSRSVKEVQRDEISRSSIPVLCSSLLPVPYTCNLYFKYYAFIRERRDGHAFIVESTIYIQGKRDRMTVVFPLCEGLYGETEWAVFLLSTPYMIYMFNMTIDIIT